MFKKLFGLTAAIAVSGVVSAESYQIDVGAMYANTEIGEADSTTLGVSGQYHFNAVDTTDKPLAEAAFLNHSSNVFGFLGRTDIETPAGDADSTFQLIGVEFYVPDTIFYLGGTFYDSDEGDSTWDATFGLYFDNLLVTTTYTDDVDYELNLEAKYVTPLANGTAIALTGSFYDYEDATEISAGVDYYFTYATSIGATVTDYDGENEYAIRARHFFTQTVYAGASYSDSDLAETIALDAGIRF